MWSGKAILLTSLISSLLGNDLLSKFNQNDFKVKDCRTELVSYNPDIVKYVKVTTFKYNRTTTAFNMSVTFLIDLEDKMEVLVQAYKFASNEYRHFPIRFQVNAKHIFDTDAGGFQGIKNCGNIQTMYLLKDVDYYFYNFVPDERKLPPFIPTGLYKPIYVACLVIKPSTLRIYLAKSTALFLYRRINLRFTSITHKAKL